MNIFMSIFNTFLIICFSIGIILSFILLIIKISNYALYKKYKKTR